MGRWTERRALYNEDDETFDPYISLDVNEYLIEHYPMLSLVHEQYKIDVYDQTKPK